MPNYLLNLVKVEDDGSSYDMGWHVTEELYSRVIQNLGTPPHGEWLFTAEDNQARKGQAGGFGVINDG